MKNYPLSTLFWLLALTISIAACSNLPGGPVYNNDGATAKSTDQQIREFLAQAEREGEPKASELRLKASSLLLDNKQKVRARAVFERVSIDQLDQGSNVAHIILSARFAQLSGDSKRVLSLLNTDSSGSGIQTSNTGQMIAVGQLRAWALQSELKAMESARERIFIDALIDDEIQLRENRESLWYSLNQMSAEQLEASAREEPAGTVRGWLTLALIHTLYRNDIFKQRDQLAIWQNEWQDHPAANNLPLELQSVLALDADIPKRVTLLLPFSGKLASAGTAIRDGFLAAYYDARQAGGMHVSMVDTAEFESFSEAYAAALQTSPDTIVGPLRKPELAALRHLATPEGPTILALNYDDEDTGSEFYQFGLAAGDEATQLATTLAQAEDGQRAMIIRPSGSWGERVAGAFKQPWLDSGSTILDEVSYSKGDNLAGLMKAALQVDKSELRRDRLQNLVGEKLEFVPRRRKDIDLFFLIARPEQARSIKPILAFHYAGDVPVYSTSQVFTGKIQRHRDRDLNGIVFTETPWLLNDNPLRNSLANFSPVSMAYARMQAFGVDAFQMTLRLAQLGRDQGSSYAGVSGRLSVDQNRRVIRELELAKFIAGRPRPWTPPPSVLTPTTDSTFDSSTNSKTPGNRGY
ncbi:MAG: penicillin-binding protein activator [Pseudomonadales bacterium]